MGQKKAPKIYGKDDTPVMVYNMKKVTKGGDQRTQNKKTKKLLVFRPLKTQFD